MKNVGCGSLIAGLIAISILMSVAKDPVGGPILLIVVIGIIGTIAYLLLKPNAQRTGNSSVSGAQSQRTLTPSEQKAQSLQKLSESLPNKGISPIPLKPGEELVYKLYQVSLIESRSNGSTYQGGSRGVSLRIAKGISYRIGASQGQMVRNPETMQVIDQGTATFTNKRMIFAGTKASREWSFDKMTDVGQSADGQTIMMSVSNRQKPSGITSTNAREIDPGTLVAVALEYNQNGLEAAKSRCLSEAGIETIKPAEPARAASNLPSDKTEVKSDSATGVTGSSGIESKPNKPYDARISEGDDLVDVVGESFYAEAFETIRQRKNMDFGESEYFELELVAEPFNKYSKNGHAVAVQIDGLVIGHISEDENTEFFNLLKTCNGRAKCQGEIYFAPVAEVMKNSVRLFCDFPPTLEGK